MLQSIGINFILALGESLRKLVASNANVHAKDFAKTDISRP